MHTKSQLKDLFSQYGFRPLKRYGENYLVDRNIVEKILKEACISSGDRILEIGPGLGALTFGAAASAAEVFAVEKDRKAFEILSELSQAEMPNIKLFNEDILTFDIGKAAKDKKIKVVGSLPYYITTPIIEYIIENRNRIESALIIVQREVADRLLAEAGSKDYSSISCYIGYYTRPEYVHTIKRTSFYPSPEVDSSLIRLKLREDAPVDVFDEKLLFKIIRGSFNQRRKSIINSLSRDEVLGLSKERLVKMLRDAGIDPARRPESISLGEFAAIANAVG